MSNKAMRRLGFQFLFLSVIVGIVVTLTTGLAENTPLVGEVDTTYHGYPFVWIIAKTGSATETRYVYLLIDMIFWTAVSFLILNLINEFYYREPSYD